MPLAVHIKYDEKTLKEARHILRGIPRALPRVMRRAINRTVDTAATDLKRRVGSEINMKKSVIAEGISKHKASKSKWEGSISTTYYRPRLIEFRGTRQTKRGVTYRINRSGRKLIAGGFIATMVGSVDASGALGLHDTAAEARGKAFAMGGQAQVDAWSRRGVFKRRGPSRLPIYEPAGPSIWYVATDTAGLLSAVQTAAGDKLTKHIDDQIGVEFRRWEKR